MSHKPLSARAVAAASRAVPNCWRDLLPHAPALFFCAVFTAAYFAQDQVAGLLVFLCIAPVLAVWLIANLAFIATRPGQRRRRIINLALVAAVIIGVVSVDEAITQAQRDAARRDADHALAQVQAFHARTGTWPDSLAEAGVDAQLIELHGMQLWRGAQGCMGLIYRDRYDDKSLGTSWYEYDCQDGSWQLVKD